jgi:hypothetical protein
MREFTITTAELPAAMQREIQRNKQASILAMIDTARQAERIVVNESPTDQGIFREAWRVVETLVGAELINDAPHAGIVEEGSRPHRPPSQPIREWIIRNMARIGIARQEAGLTAPLTTKTGKPRAVRKDQTGNIIPEDEQVINQLTYLICSKIAREGTKPHFLLKNNQIVFLSLMEQNLVKRLSM